MSHYKAIKGYTPKPAFLVSNGRTTVVSKLTYKEAAKLINALNDYDMHTKSELQLSNYHVVKLSNCHIVQPSN